ncbi:MAG: 50S ribosomal protein L32 [Coriobacteriia bacterium]|nr:50S ribosomal protein L32 [Coriobacteriia bacterium]
MAVPKRKKGRAKIHSRRSSNSRLMAAPRAVCPQCGEAKLPHFVCSNCGTYKGREVIITD